MRLFIYVMVIGLSSFFYQQWAVEYNRRKKLLKIPQSLETRVRNMRNGKLPTNVRKHLKLSHPGWLESFRNTPGRIDAHVQPYHVNGENVWCYALGLKTTASEKPFTHVYIPVYPNGNIYEH